MKAKNKSSSKMDTLLNILTGCLYSTWELNSEMEKKWNISNNMLFKQQLCLGSSIAQCASNYNFQKLSYSFPLLVPIFWTLRILFCSVRGKFHNVMEILRISRNKWDTNLKPIKENQSMDSHSQVTVKLLIMTHKQQLLTTLRLCFICTAGFKWSNLSLLCKQNGDLIVSNCCLHVLTTTSQYSHTIYYD